MTVIGPPPSARLQGLDVLVSRGLRDGNDQPVLECIDARIEPTKRNPAEDAALDQRMDCRPRFDRKLQREFVEKAIVDQFYARDIAASRSAASHARA